MKNFEGRLYSGRLFAGRLFRAPAGPRQDVIPYAGKMRAAEKKRGRDRDDDVLLFILR